MQEASKRRPAISRTGLRVAEKEERKNKSNRHASSVEADRTSRGGTTARTELATIGAWGPSRLRGFRLPHRPMLVRDKHFKTVAVSAERSARASMSEVEPVKVATADKATSLAVDVELSQPSA